MENQRNNIILIGMPGAGKSVIGEALAKKFDLQFVDIDKVIEKREQKHLQVIIDEIGDDGFVEKEKEAVLGLEAVGCVVSTGGSVVLREETINHLKNSGILVFLDTPLEILRTRLRNLDARGVVGIRSGMTLEEIFNLRQPLYQKYADLTVNLPPELSLDEMVNILTATLRKNESNPEIRKTPLRVSIQKME